VEENFGGQLDTQHAQVFQLCLCSSNRNYVHQKLALRCPIMHLLLCQWCEYL